MSIEFRNSTRKELEMDYNTPKYVVVYSVVDEEGALWAARVCFNQSDLDYWLDNEKYYPSYHVHQIIDLDRVKGE